MNPVVERRKYRRPRRRIVNITGWAVATIGAMLALILLMLGAMLWLALNNGVIR